MADEAVTQSQQSVHLKARVIVRGEGGCGFERVVGMADVWKWWAGGDGDRFTEKREVLLR